jgi:fatty acid desaturase
MNADRMGAGPRPERGRILARPEDVHCVVFHLVTLGCYAGAFWLYLNPEVAGIDGPWSRAAFVVAAAWLLGWISGVDVGVNFHNHTHRRIFRHSLLNRWGGRLWTFSGGWPSFYWQYAHVVVHHGKLLESEDWTLPRRTSDGEFENYHRYTLLHWPFRYFVHLFCDFRASNRRLRRRAVVELAIFALLYSIPFWIDPMMAVWLWLLPHWVGNLVMGAGMYSQHACCVQKTESQPVSHSNTFLNGFFNQTMFNIGYHTAHHDHPNVHWSDLPEFHLRHRRELIEGRAHVVPFGYYGAGHLLKSFTDPAGARQRFTRAALSADEVANSR